MWVPSTPVALISALAATGGALCIFKDMYGGPPFDREARADNKTVIITGATSGIGREAAWDFARRGAKVFMACRDMAKCETIRRDIVLETRNKYVYCRLCDLASLNSVREFVNRFKQEEPHVHVLVNNAAVMEPPRGVTQDGFETQLGVNHLGHFLLTNLLIDTLKASGAGRVVVVSCASHRRGRVLRQDLNMAARYDAAAAYCQAKLANVLFATELARRLLGSGVSVSVVDPGLTDTNITRHMSMMSSITRFLVYPLFWPVMKNAKIGSQVILHAALDPKLQDCAGDYFVDMKKVEPSKEAYNFELALWLWQVSEKWTKLDEHKAALDKVKAG